MKMVESSTGLRKRDWQIWFRLGMIVTLLVISFTSAKAQELTPVPVPPEEKTSPADQPLLFLPKLTDEQQVEETDSEAEIEQQADEEADAEELTAEAEQADETAQPNQAITVPLPAPPAQKFPTHTSRKFTLLGTLAPLASSQPDASEQTKTAVKEEAPKPATEAPKPEPVPAATGEAPQQEKAPEPVDPKSRWTMLITPHQAGSSYPSGLPTLNTFQLDAKSGQVQGEPTVEVLGLEAAVQQAESSAEADSKPRFPSSNSAVVHHKPRGHVSFGSEYRAIYDSIPYSHAEYLANPAYRHEATLEILFGQMRPTTIHKQDTPRRVYNHPPVSEPGSAHPYASPLVWPHSLYRPRFSFWAGPGLTYHPAHRFYGAGYHGVW